MGNTIKEVQEAQREFSVLVERASMGEKIIIAKNGVPVAQLVPYGSTKGRRVPGCGKAKIWIADDFNDPLPEELLRAFYEGPIEPSN